MSMPTILNSKLTGVIEICGVVEARYKSERLAGQSSRLAVDAQDGFGVSFLENKDDIFEDWREKFLNTYKTGLMYWPFMQFLNFILIPLYLRTAFMGCCAFLWATFLCFSRQSGDGTASVALAFFLYPKQRLQAAREAHLARKKQKEEEELQQSTEN
ncbi:mpv17-like protein isoform X2 [Coregonus clupeaformis]|uniref:mpv17-like protein isoform X2 n=1 Tax=Coregonus clupeaformis TaxID=59861 RepID=UPI001BE0DAE3|nr:mpv17-like protein isoform X2 [Coregonus clupeaformis]